MLKPLKNFASLKIKDILTIIGLILIGFAWILIDQVFIKQSSYRFIAFAGLLIILFYLQFRINKPKQTWHYANTIALILLIFVVLSSVVMHAIIKHDFISLIGHSIILWTMTAALPYMAGLIYLITSKK